MDRRALTPSRRLSRLLLLSALLVEFCGGCRLASFASQPAQTSTDAAQAASVPSPDGLASVTEIAELLNEAAQLDKRNDAASVDAYAAASLRAYPLVCNEGSSPTETDVVAMYHQAVAGLLSTALRHQRFAPDWSIPLKTGEGPQQIQASFPGNRWQATDYSTIELARDFDRKKLRRNWVRDGFGVPLVATRRSAPGDAFLGKRIPFASTAILLPASPEARSQGVIGYLEFHDPLNEDMVAVGTVPRPITRDLSAPLALAESEFDSEAIKNFLRPARVDDGAGLKMTEPYRPGKVPLIFVHGLVSDKFTWVNMYNDLRATPGFTDNFQVWAFQYATGQSFLQSGKELRNSLNDAVATLDPEGKDPALHRMVLVGHSMGGLVSKLQVTSSGTQLWDQYVSRPFSEVPLPEQEAESIASNFFFEPSPFVRRVVFIGSPHQGSKWAHSFVARIGSNLVRMPSDRTKLLKKLIKEDPAVFHETLRKGFPSSVDLLRKDSPLLTAMYDLPVSPRVDLHTIIGTGRSFLDGTPADGVVPVTSARHPRTVSELMVDATHTELTGHPDSVSELRRILGVHLQASNDEVRISQSYDTAAKR